MLSLACQKYEQERSQVCFKPELVISLLGVQPVKKRKQLIVSPEPPPIKDVIEETETPRLENASDADDEWKRTCTPLLWNWKMMNWKAREVIWPTCHST